MTLKKIMTSPNHACGQTEILHHWLPEITD